MPLKICRNQEILFVRETAGYSIALHGCGKDIKGLLITCPILNDLLPDSTLPTIPGVYLWQGTFVEERDPMSVEVQTRYWLGSAVPVKDAEVTRVFTTFGDHASATLILIAAFRAASTLQELNP